MWDMVYSLFIAKKTLMQMAKINSVPEFDELLDWVGADAIYVAIVGCRQLPKEQREQAARDIFNKWGDESEYEYEEHLPWYY